MDLNIRRLCPALGAEVTGLDVSQPLSDDAFHEVRAAWLASHGVLVIREQHLTPEQHLAFSRRFGPLFGEADELQETVKKYLLPGHPGIYRVSNKVRDGVPQGRARAGTYWHSDVSFRERPAMASLLHAIETPTYGGDTLFASMVLAYDRLSDKMKQLLEGMHAIHDFAVAAPATYRPEQLEQSDFDGQDRCVHPVIITHPETGRKALFVNPGFTSHLQGFDAKESVMLLSFLYEHATQPEFILRHAWKPNDLVIWDNRCVMHYAIADYDGLGDRYMHRTTVIGERPRN